ARRDCRAAAHRPEHRRTDAPGPGGPAVPRRHDAHLARPVPEGPPLARRPTREGPSPCTAWWAFVLTAAALAAADGVVPAGRDHFCTILSSTSRVPENSFRVMREVEPAH